MKKMKFNELFNEFKGSEIRMDTIYGGGNQTTSGDTSSGGDTTQTADDCDVDSGGVDTVKTSGGGPAVSYP